MQNLSSTMSYDSNNSRLTPEIIVRKAPKSLPGVKAGYRTAKVKPEGMLAKLVDLLTDMIVFQTYSRFASISYVPQPPPLSSNLLHSITWTTSRCWKSDAVYRLRNVWAGNYVKNKVQKVWCREAEYEQAEESSSVYMCCSSAFPNLATDPVLQDNF